MKNLTLIGTQKGDSFITRRGDKAIFIDKVESEDEYNYHFRVYRNFSTEPSDEFFTEEGKAISGRISENDIVKKKIVF